MSLRASAFALVVVLVVGCSDGGADTGETIAPDEGADTAIGAVEDLVASIGDPDFAEASRFAVPEQAALAALAEGATFGTVAEALREGDEEIAANFWSGFAQGAGAFLTGPIELSEEGTLTEQDVEFHRISVTPADGDDRSIFVLEDDGYRVDLFASFGPGLADKMIPQVERLLTTQTADARLILDHLQDIVPSLLVAAQLPGNSGEVTQQLLTLVEVITRVG
jgi:hypothetical protein